MSDGMAVIGRELTMAVTSDIRVASSLWVSFCALVSNSMGSRMHRIVPI